MTRRKTWKDPFPKSEKNPGRTRMLRVTIADDRGGEIVSVLADLGDYFDLTREQLSHVMFKAKGAALREIGAQFRAAHDRLQN